MAPTRQGTSRAPPPARLRASPDAVPPAACLWLPIAPAAPGGPRRPVSQATWPVARRGSVRPTLCRINVSAPNGRAVSAAPRHCSPQHATGTGPEGEIEHG